MSEVNRATILGTGTMGPGMGAVLARAGLSATLFDVNPEALERAKATVSFVEGVLDRLEVPDQGGGSLSPRRAGIELPAEIVIAPPRRPGPAAGAWRSTTLSNRCTNWPVGIANAWPVAWSR